MIERQANSELLREEHPFKKGFYRFKQQDLFTFIHNYKGTEKELSVWLIPDYREGREAYVSIEIMDGDGNDIGKIAGVLEQKGNRRNFYVEELFNNTFDRSVSSVPRAVGATIAQLVMRNIVMKWHSSYAPWLSMSARDMYERYLAGNSDLEVQKPDEILPVYIVTARRELRESFG